MPRTEPAVISHRGPIRSIARPTAMPTSPAVTCPAEKAAVMVGADHPVSAVMDVARTGNA